MSGLRWTITSAYTERDTGDPDCPNYRVGATVKGPERREPIEVVPASALEGAASRIATALIDASEDPDHWAFVDFEESDREALERIIAAALDSPSQGGA